MPDEEHDLDEETENKEIKLGDDVFDDGSIDLGSGDLELEEAEGIYGASYSMPRGLNE